MQPGKIKGLLLDTHILIRWLLGDRRLSKDQRRVLRQADRNRQSVGVSAISLIEIAVLAGAGSLRLKAPADELLGMLETMPILDILPVSVEIAREVVNIGRVLPDPADRTIVATARVYGLRLLSSDQRIIESNMVSVIP